MNQTIQNQVLYDAADRGYDQRFWRTTIGTPAWDVSAPVITFDQAAAYSFDKFKHGSFTFSLANLPDATSTNVIEIGLKNQSLGNVGLATFKVDLDVADKRLLAVVGDADGTLTTFDIEVDDSTFWDSAHDLKISTQANTVRFFVDGVMRYEAPINTWSDELLNIYINNEENDTLTLTYLEIIINDLIEKHLAMPRVYDAQDIATAGTESDADLKAAGSSTLFVNVPNARRMVIRSLVVGTIKLNSTSMPGIAIKANTIYEWGGDEELGIYDIYLTTATALANAIQIELYP